MGLIRCWWLDWLLIELIKVNERGPINASMWWHYKDNNIVTIFISDRPLWPIDRSLITAKFRRRGFVMGRLVLRIFTFSLDCSTPRPFLIEVEYENSLNHWLEFVIRSIGFHSVFRPSLGPSLSVVRWNSLMVGDPLLKIRTRPFDYEIFLIEGNSAPVFFVCLA